MPARMLVLYVVVNMEVPQMSKFMEIPNLPFRELYNPYILEFVCFCFPDIHFKNFYTISLAAPFCFLFKSSHLVSLS